MERRSEADPGAGLDLVEHLCSRLCHDLAGPIGAVRNGLELIAESREDGEDSDAGPALDLIGHSAEQAARRLRLFRLAYGRAICEGTRSFAEARDAALDWLTGSRVALHWPVGQPDDALAPQPGLVRLVLNLVVLAVDTIPTGGVVTVTEADAGGVLVKANGRNLKWPDEISAALLELSPVAALGPRTLHAALTGRFAVRDRLVLSWQTLDTETLVLRLVGADAGREGAVP